MKKRILVAIALICSLIGALSIVFVVNSQTQTQQTQTVHISGNSTYPRNTPYPNATGPLHTPTPTSAAQGTVQFSLFFLDGTPVPASTNGSINGGILTVPTDPITGHNDEIIPSFVVIRNDGNVPITVSVTVINKNVPSDMDFYFGTACSAIPSGPFKDTSTDKQPIQPGQTYGMTMAAQMLPNKGDYTPGQQFSYSYDIVVTATQA